MKKFLINTILLIFLSTFVVDLVSGFKYQQDTSIETTTEKSDQKSEPEKLIKDKFFIAHETFIEIGSAKESQYLEFSFFLPQPYLSRIEMPPEQV